VQSTAIDGGHGALHQGLTTLDYLLTTLESLKTAQTHLSDTHFKASINLGWRKINKCLELTNRTPAYRLAAFLHPHYKMRWFEVHRHDKQEWIAEVERVIKEAYAAGKREWSDDIPARSSPSQELDDFDRYNNLADDEEEDDLMLYLRESRASKDIKTLEWWQANHHRFPVLRHLALAY
jgi:hypothetical protein